MRLARTLAALSALALLSACHDTVAPDAPPSTPASSHEGQFRTGYILTPAGKPARVSFEVREGRAVLEGDIDLGPAEAIAPTAEALLRAGGPRYGVYVTGSGYRWPGGQVPYAVSTAFTAAQKDTILKAMQYVQSRSPGVKFVPRTSHSDYVEFITSTVCESKVGRIGGKQQIKLVATTCAMDAGVVAHEVLHALGLFHEQSRCDRDLYVEILEDNILDGKEDNFAKHCLSGDDIYEYDEGSVMHYGAYDFGKPDFYGLPLQTIRSLRNRAMGQRDSLTITDVKTIDWLYAPPLSVTGSYPGGTPTLTWPAYAGASRYEVYRVRAEEIDDYELGYSFTEYREHVGTAYGTSITDPGATYTGSDFCSTTSMYTRVSESYYYEVTVYTSYTSAGQTTSRLSAYVAPC